MSAVSNLNFATRTILDLDLVYFNPKYPHRSSNGVIRRARFVVGFARQLLLNRAIRKERRRAARFLTNVPDLHSVYHEYKNHTSSTGVSASDYVRLYRIVRELKPGKVLECGTGMSTTAIVMALRHNYEQDGYKGICVSMEESLEWHEQALALMPEHLLNWVDLRHSPAVEKEVRGMVGVCYRDMPDYAYEFAFIDGPVQRLRKDGRKLFDLDLVYVVDRNPNVCAIIDQRLYSVWCLKQLLADTHHVTYNPVAKLSYVTSK